LEGLRLQLPTNSAGPGRAGSGKTKSAACRASLSTWNSSLGGFLQQLDPVAELGGMALDLVADLQPITQQHR
jgi:hypothetical protein